MLNTHAPMMLSHHFARKMIERVGGGIIMLSSIVAFQGVPLITTYAASKAFDLVFGEGLAAELKPMRPIAIAKAILNSLGKRGMIIPGLIDLY